MATLFGLATSLGNGWLTGVVSIGLATATYLARLLKPLGVLVSRIGMGIPVGTELDYVDEATMMEAMDGRREL